MKKVTVILVSHNMGYYIKKAISSILSQSEKEFELYVIDDASTDNTQKIISSIKDKRLRYLCNRKRLGIAKSRNKGISLSKGTYIFFTDADCKVDKHWLKHGIAEFKKGVVGVEGKIYYVSKTYVSTYSDRIVQNLQGSEFMTANMAYKKDIFTKAGRFNPIFKRNSDRDFALRAKKFGNIVFSPRMLVFHTVSKWKPLSYLKSANWVYFRTVLFFKFYKEKYLMFGRIYAPQKLFALVFPPILLIKLFTDKHESFNDYLLFLLLYPRLVYERLTLWRAAIQERVFII